MKFLKSLYPVLIWQIVIWTLSSLPSRSIPSFKIIGMDKLAHMFVYFILGILLNFWLRSRKFRLTEVVFIYALLILLAAADEYHQYYIPGRSVMVYDLMANVIGLLSAFTFYFARSGLRKAQ